MSHRACVFDVETAPNPALFNLAFDAAQRRAEARRNDDPNNIDPEAVKQEMALSPVFGQIVAAGLLDAGTQEVSIEIGPECEILERFWRLAAGYGFFAGFNSLGFDLPWLVLRSSLNGICLSVRISQARYRAPGDSNHLDLYAWLTDWRGNRTKHLKLDLATVARAVGVEPPTGDSAEVPKLYQAGDEAAIRRHLEGDLWATLAIWDRLGRPGFEHKDSNSNSNSEAEVPF